MREGGRNEGGKEREQEAGRGGEGGTEEREEGRIYILSTYAITIFSKNT